MRDRWLADADDPALVALDGLAEEAGQVAAEARHFLVRPVILPGDAVTDTGFRVAVGRLAAGENLGLFQSLFARQLKTQVAAVRLSGRPPSDGSEWAEVHRYLALSDRAVRLAAAWNHAGPLAGVDPVSGQEPAAAEAMRRQLAQIAALRTLARDERALSDAVRTILPGWRRPLTGDDAATEALIALCEQHLRLFRLSAAEDERDRWTLRRLSTWLRRVDRHDRLRTLEQERGEQEMLLRRAYEEAIELRT